MRSPPPHFGGLPPSPAEKEAHREKGRAIRKACTALGAVGAVIFFAWLLSAPGKAQTDYWYNGSANWTVPWWFNNTTSANSTYNSWYRGNVSNFTGLGDFFGMLTGGGPWSIFGENAEIAGWIILFLLLFLCLVGRLPMDTIIIITVAACITLPVAGLGSIWMWGIAVAAAGYITIQAILYWLSRGGFS